MRNGVLFVGVGYRPVAGAAQPKAPAGNGCWLARSGWPRGLRSAL